MSTYVFKITCLTNLHAGSGDSGGFGVVDKTVQRDPATNLPTIHASGLKGALREHFRHEPWVNYVFGSDQNNRAPGSSQQGAYHFFAADLLALPKPAQEAPYFEIVTNQEYLKSLGLKYQQLGAKTLTVAQLVEGLNNDPQFWEIAEDLPVIARNQLDNGVSKNLWYEEVVPRQSMFVVGIQIPDVDGKITSGSDDTEQTVDREVLIKALKEAVIQIGGNATVGYGFCLFTQIHPKP